MQPCTRSQNWVNWDNIEWKKRAYAQHNSNTGSLSRKWPTGRINTATLPIYERTESFAIDFVNYFDNTIQSILTILKASHVFTMSTHVGSLDNVATKCNLSDFVPVTQEETAYRLSQWLSKTCQLDQIPPKLAKQNYDIKT